MSKDFKKWIKYGAIVFVAMFFGFLIAGNQPTIETGSTSSNQQSTSESTQQSVAEDTRTTIDLKPDEIVTITDQQAGKYIIQKQVVENSIGFDGASTQILTVNGENKMFDNSISLKAGDQVMVTNCTDVNGQVVTKLVPTK